MNSPPIRIHVPHGEGAPPVAQTPMQIFALTASPQPICLLLNLPMGGAIAPVPHWQGRGPRPASPCPASAPYQLLVYASCVLVSTVGCHQTSILFASAHVVCSRVLGFPNLTGRLFLSGEALLTGVTLQEYTRRYMLHHFSEERSLKGVLFPGFFTVSLVERGEGA